MGPSDGRFGQVMVPLLRGQRMVPGHTEPVSAHISWLWDGGVDVRAGDEERNFRAVADISPWLRHWYGLGANEPDQLENELQKIYDSEIHLTIRAGGERILVALGTDFTGLERKGYVDEASDILPRLQSLIHENAPFSKYDVERLGGRFTVEMARITK